ncbi:MAG: N-methyl-L-tryptophan oxidase, partial [Tepidisphaeraceae bacterium]
MDQRFDVIVIGVGGMGSAACFHLARRGVRVLGLEQFNIPHDRGSSQGLSRMIRTAYYEHSDYVPLLRRAWELWKQFEDEAHLEKKVLHKTGGLYLGRLHDELIAGSLASSRQQQLPYELLSRDDLRKQFPQFHVPDDFVGFYEYHAGYLVPELAITAHVDLAMRQGATIRGNEPVLSWTTDAAGATVTTARGTYHAEQVVFCGGAWTDKLIRDLGVPLVVTRQVMAWVAPPRPALFSPDRFPVWAITSDRGGIDYGFPMDDPRVGLKLAHHFPGPPTDPERVNRAPQTDDKQTFRPALQKYLPDADGPLISLLTCLYTNSP